MTREMDPFRISKRCYNRVLCSRACGANGGDPIECHSPKVSTLPPALRAGAEPFQKILRLSFGVPIRSGGMNGKRR